MDLEKTTEKHIWNFELTNKKKAKVIDFVCENQNGDACDKLKLELEMNLVNDVLAFN